MDRRNSLPLNAMAVLSGWPSPLANKTTPQTREDFTPNLAARAAMAGWNAPTCNTNNQPTTRRGLGTLLGQCKIVEPMRRLPSGQIQTGSDAGMESGGQLNPEHSRWLMGYPVEWDFCGDMAMRLCRKSRQK